MEESFWLLSTLALVSAFAEDGKGLPVPYNLRLVIRYLTSKQPFVFGRDAITISTSGGQSIVAPHKSAHLHHNHACYCH